MNNWNNAQIISTVINASGAVVGLVINLPPVQISMRFSAIEDRMDARWNQIDKELRELAAWWESPTTACTQANRAHYLAEDARLTAERRYLEALWQQVRSYMPHAEAIQ